MENRVKLRELDGAGFFKAGGILSGLWFAIAFLSWAVSLPDGCCRGVA